MFLLFIIICEYIDDFSVDFIQSIALILAILCIMPEDPDFRFKNQLFVSDHSAINFYFHLHLKNFSLLILINTFDDKNRIFILSQLKTGEIHDSSELKNSFRKTSIDYDCLF
jgi:hypothetical protein